MDRNSVIGLLLIGSILVGYSLWMAPSQDELEARQKAQDSLEAITKSSEILQSEGESSFEEYSEPMTESSELLEPFDSDPLDKDMLVQQYGLFASASRGEEQLYTFENDKLIISFTNKEEG